MLKKPARRKAMHRKGIELTANFLVVIILSIAMLGFGIYFTRQIFMKSTTMTEQLDSQTSQRIEELLSDGSRVVIPFQTKTETHGNIAVYGIGVLNTLGGTRDFKIQVLDNGNPPAAGSAKLIHPSAGFRKDSAPMSAAELEKVALLYHDDAVTLENLKNTKFTFGASVLSGAPSGTYIINLRILYYNTAKTPAEWTPYGDSLYKLYLVVP
jgi:hypothetical protein